MERIYWFFFIFSIVMFLEAIGQSYMVTAIQSMERQFQIPSKLSGFMVSASDFGYIPTVIFISYFGSKGNRAKWISVGALMTAVAYTMIASPNFFFPAQKPHLNLTTIKDALAPDPELLLPNVTIPQFVGYAPIYDQIPADLRKRILTHFGNRNDVNRVRRELRDIRASESAMKSHPSDLYSVDEGILLEVVEEMEAILEGRGKDEDLRGLLEKFVQNRMLQEEKDIKKMKRSAIAPFAFCNRLINDLRTVLADEKCERKVSTMGPFLVIFVALVILGVGRTMPWSLGLPMIDDNVKRKSLPTFFAGLSFLRILGPITGFLIGSFSNKLYYNLQRTFCAIQLLSPAPLGLTARDPTWIGAWWLGFLLIGLILFAPATFLYFFPASKQTSSVMPTQANGGPDGLKDPKAPKALSFFDKHAEERKTNRSWREKIKDFQQSYSRVITSKVYMGAVVGRMLDTLAFRGYMVFLPKYLENHYGLPQYQAHQLMAMFGVFGFALGTACGGFVMKKLKLNGRRAATYVFIVSSLNVFVFFLKTFIGCNSVVNTVGILGRETQLNYTSGCNVDCGCENAPLFPVCSKDGAPYFSPCHAGCRQVRVKDISSYHLEFLNCDCSPGEVLKREYCQDDCRLMTVIFFVTVMAGAFIAGCGLVPGMLILLRSVPPAQRSISLGLQGFLVSLFATLPSPLLWGFIFDSACLVWNHTCSGGSGACAIYEPNLLRTRVHLVYVGIRCISAITDLYVIYYAKGLNILEEDEKKPEIPSEEIPESIPM